MFGESHAKSCNIILGVMWNSTGVDVVPTMGSTPVAFRLLHFSPLFLSAALAAGPPAVPPVGTAPPAKGLDADRNLVLTGRSADTVGALGRSCGCCGCGGGYGLHPKVLSAGSDLIAEGGRVEAVPETGS